MEQIISLFTTNDITTLKIYLMTLYRDIIKRIIHKDI